MHRNRSVPHSASTMQERLDFPDRLVIRVHFIIVSVHERSAFTPPGPLSRVRYPPRGLGAGTTADRPVASRDPRTPLPTPAQLLELVLTSLPRSAGGAQARGQGPHRTQARRPTGAPRTSSPPTAPRARHGRRAVRAHRLRPLPGPLAPQPRPRRPRTDLASGRRGPRARGGHHRVSRACAHLPVL